MSEPDPSGTIAPEQMQKQQEHSAESEDDPSKLEARSAGVSPPRLDLFENVPEFHN
jgi:hypothetical protein